MAGGSEGKVYDLQDRLVDLAVRATTVCDSLPSTRTGRHVAAQLIRCGTAAAPLYAEASAAESRRDFVHKLGMCLKELRETMSWLRYLERLKIGGREAVAEAIDEADQLIAIVYTSIRTARQNDRIKAM